MAISELVRLTKKLRFLMPEFINIKELLEGLFDPKNESALEAKFQQVMRKFDLPFKQQIWAGNRRLDFVLDEKINIELDGDAYHEPVRDQKRDAEVASLGYSVVRIKEKVCYYHTEEALAWIVHWLCSKFETSKVKQYLRREVDYSLYLKIFEPESGLYQRYFL